MSTSPGTRSQLIKTLNALPPQQFNQLLYALNPPAGVVPPASASQGDRAYALLSWAEGPTGCELAKVQQILDGLKPSVASSNSGSAALERLRKSTKFRILVGVTVVSLGIGIPVFLQNNPELAKLLPFTPEVRAESSFNGGLDKYKKGDRKGAVENYSQAIDIKPNYAEAYYQRGVSHYELGDKQTADNDFKEAIRHNPNYAEAYYRRGLIQYESKDKDKSVVREAIESFTKAIGLKRSYAEAYYQRGIARKDLGDSQTSITDFDHAIQHNPNYAEAYYERGVHFFQLKDTIKNSSSDPSSMDVSLALLFGNPRVALANTAIQNFTKAIELKPNYAEAYNDKGYVYYWLGKQQEAIKNYSLAIDIKPTVPFHENRGDAYYKLGDKQKAIEDYSEVINLDKDYAYAFYQRGKTRYEIGDKKGIEDLQKAADLCKKNKDEHNYKVALDTIKELQANN